LAVSATIPLDVATASLPEPARLSAEDAAYLRSFAAFCEEEDAREPGVIDLEIAAARTYGTDFARERADIEAGCHPLQRPR
jgi:hypothetical protein